MSSQGLKNELVAMGQALEKQKLDLNEAFAKLESDQEMRQAKRRDILVREFKDMHRKLRQIDYVSFNHFINN